MTSTTPHTALLLVRRTHVTDAEVMLALVHEFTTWAATASADDAESAVDAFLAERSRRDGTMTLGSVPCLHRLVARTLRASRRCPRCRGTGHRTVALRVHRPCRREGPLAA